MAHTKCPNENCSWAGEPVMDMAANGRIVPSCPECGFGFSVSEPPVSYGVTFSPPAKATTGFIHVEAEDVDIFAMAKRRLAAIEIELTAARKLEAEAARLRRMIAAAEDTEDVSPVADH